jgi:hypothetical protein
VVGLVLGVLGVGSGRESGQIIAPRPVSGSFGVTFACFGRVLGIIVGACGRLLECLGCLDRVTSALLVRLACFLPRVLPSGSVRVSAAVFWAELLPPCAALCFRVVLPGPPSVTHSRSKALWLTQAPLNCLGC